ncbi:class I SAM-dependent DNA methyltransferase [Streptomyces antibioticus]|uniref:class I SAM-dependent DNA methyltransferase n=1 Tax=Streptomyces antibioticus TaxID=1890 RepID=UPI003722AB6D
MSDLDGEFLRAIRESYDAIAEAYAAEFPDVAGRPPLDRAVLSAFAESVRARGGTEPVADVGCGPGQVTALLDSLGVPVFGVDVSPRMVALAGRAHPGLRFHVGSMTRLGLPDRSLGGVLALYSLIHVPDSHHPLVFREFRRVLADGGQLLLAFQTGHGEREHRTERFGREISLDYHWRDPEAVAGLLVDAGFEIRARMVLEPDDGAKRPRAYLFARTPDARR